MRALFLVTLAVALGCDSVSLHPTVYVDAAFAPDEVGPLLYGVDAWDRATGGTVSFHYETRAHDALQDARIYEDDAVYLVRSAEGSTGCPLGYPVLPNKAATTHRAFSYAVICFDASRLNPAKNENRPELGAWGVWSAAGAHEMGHALGLGHASTRAAVMWPNVSETEDVTPTCEDVRALANARGFSVPARCQ